MPKPEDEMAATERGLRNVLFLIEMQMRLVTDLTEAGHESTEARVMLRRLMDLEETLRRRAETLRASGVASVAA